MTTRLGQLQEDIAAALGERIAGSVADRGELTIVVRAADLASAMKTLRDDPSLSFSLLVDLLGIDYSGFADGAWEGPRFAVIYNLLSIDHNRRVRVKAFCPEDELPVLDTMVNTWTSADWFEREAFDLYGIVFRGHPDLRRILTDYGFVGHPFRKDFPLSGNVEMRYDPDQQRVIYQPVTIEPREITPRIVRVENYADTDVKKG
jgi:NADH-quinone oxidoreductase subunit C